MCVFVNYCYFPDKKEHQGASWQIRWQRETGGVQMRNTEHPERDETLTDHRSGCSRARCALP